MKHLEPIQDFTLLNTLNEGQLKELAFLANEVQTDISHIQAAIQDLQDLCRTTRDEEIDKYINGDILADIKDILKKVK